MIGFLLLEFSEPSGQLRCAGVGDFGSMTSSVGLLWPGDEALLKLP
jgi:hypothetical protein